MKSNPLFISSIVNTLFPETTSGWTMIICLNPFFCENSQDFFQFCKVSSTSYSFQSLYPSYWIIMSGWNFAILLIKSKYSYSEFPPGIPALIISNFSGKYSFVISCKIPGHVSIS